MKKFRTLFTFILTFIFVFGFAFWSLIMPDKDMSKTERRPLEQFPEVSLENIANRTFMTDFELYSLDQFPLRDGFRGLKSFVSLKLLKQKDNNDLFVTENHIFKIDYPTSTDSAIRASKIFSDINKQYLTENNKVYLSVIPDKNYYISDKNGKLLLNYDLLVDTLKNNCGFADYIDISGLLSLDDFYSTDSHWKQENITDVANKLLDSMNAECVDSETSIINASKDFYGVYHGQLGLKIEPDEINYLLNDVISSAVVFNYETGKQEDVYNLHKLNGNDPYEIYLSGPVSLITINNDKNKNEKELVIFRDSFSSSIAPLLLKGYSKITLVDIRYLSSKTLGQYLEFDNQDVLFLYSTSVINNSVTLK